MKYFYFSICLVFSCFVSGQIINFPDANFKAKLLLPYVAATNDLNDIYLDDNNDGEIEVSELENVWFLDVSNADISDLTGISYFTSLKSFRCNNNMLTTLVIDDIIGLNYLNASHNALTSVDVNFGSSLDRGLNLSFNNLTSYTIEDGYYEEAVDLSNNQLTNLVINNANFNSFSVNNNSLSSIQINGSASAYSYASFSNNQFTFLDLSNFGFGFNTIVSIVGNSNLERVHFRENGAHPGYLSYSSANSTFLDLENYHRSANCDGDYSNLSISNSPNLETLILKNGFNHTEVTCNEGGNIFQIPDLNLSISNCPSLSFICVDEFERPFIQAEINQLGLENQVQVNSYCTFTPGGTYYTVNGASQFDSNNNGCDVNDFYIPFQKITITNGSEIGTIISDESGNYTINTGAGTHTITPIIENAVGFTASPPNVTVNFPSETSPVTQNFCLSPATALHDFEVTLIPVNPAVPGFDSNYKIVYKNTGNTIDDGIISLNFSDNVLDFTSSSMAPTTISSGNLQWSFTNLIPFETRTFDVTFNLNSPMETPPLNGNDVLSFTTSIGETGAVQPYPNTHVLNQTVVNSFDPNDKVCLEGETLSTDFIGNYVSYKIRFENTGTFPALNIVVKDVIDITKFDLSTLTPILGSHNFYTRINGNNVEFIFENINLPFDDASNDGFVVFKIKLLPEVIPGITFDNQASIYFDYNFPIITNTASSVINTLGTTTFDLTNTFTVFPVPARNFLQILSKDNLEVISIEIYNTLTQIVQKEIGNKNTIDVSRLVNGSYFLKIKTYNSTDVVRFLKE